MKLRFTIYDLRFTREGRVRRVNRQSSIVNRAGFSLIEILVTLGLLSFIILGLLAMFIQTQKAFRGSMKQTDVLGAGRAIMDMFGRELAQMTPSQMARTTNFLVEVEQKTFGQPPLFQGLPGTGPVGGPQVQRTNVVQQFFFLTLVNQDWVGTGYKVVVGDYNNGLGTLYRYTASARNAGVSQLSSNFFNVPPTNMSRIADGIVHLRVRAYATNGFPIVGGFFNASWFRTNVLTKGIFPVKNTAGFWDPILSDQVDCYFVSNAVPAYVELELGILEPQVADRAKSIPGPPWPAPATAARDYLSNHVAQVHLFRQRVPVRNVDFNAYQ